MKKPTVQQEISCFVLPVFALQISTTSFYFSVYQSIDFYSPHKKPVASLHPG
jgi:hypothetical protein